TAFAKGTTTVNVTATDDAGNQDFCSFDVTVNDTEDPVAICPDNITVSNDAGECGAIVNFSLDATDNCPGVTVDADFASGSMFPIGETTVTVTAHDAANNTNQCQFTITVNDVEPPTAICPANVEVGNDPGDCGAIVIFDLQVDDNCSGANVTSDPPSGSFFEIGTTTVTVTATDGAALTDQCFFDVTVNDTEDPVAICPGDINIQVDEGTIEQAVEFTIDATDNCPGVTVEAVPPSGSLFSVGSSTLVIVTATDAAGNTDQCTFDVLLSEQLIPDYSVTSDVDTFFATEGIPTNFNGVVTVTSINSWTDPITLSTSALPTGVNIGFSVNPVNPTGNSDLSGSTDETTPAGTYPISIIGSPVPPPKDNGHEHVIYLVVEPCSEAPVVGLSQTYFEITIQEGEDAEDVEVYITNEAACGVLDWVSASDQDWAVPNPDFGSVQAGDVPGDLMAIELNTTSVGVGDHTAMISVNPVTKVAGLIQIDLHVLASADTVWVAENVVGYPGLPVTVPVTVRNNELLAGMSIGLMWDNPILYLDSISFVGSRVDYVTNKTTVIDNGDQTIGTGLFIIPGGEMQVPVGSGGWFNLHFTVDGGASGGTVVGIDSMFIETNPGTGIELIFNDSLGTEIYPQFVAGSVVIDDSPQMLCGVVEDEGGVPIPFAEVELYLEFPSMDAPLQTTTADANGEFCFDLVPAAGKSNGVNSALEGDDYVVRAYMQGYYPGTEGTDFPNTDITVVLAANAGEVTPTLEWVDLYCAEAYFDDMLLPLGTVIEAFDMDDHLCGQWTVTEEGRYGFMPVYTDDPWTAEDEGCDTNEVITLRVNGFEVEPFNAPLIWVGNGERIETCFDGHSIIELCFDLYAGWNLISWNVNSEFDDVDSIFQSIMPDVDVILGFEAEGLTYDPDLVEFSTLHETDHFHGFWVRMNAPAEFCVKGMFVDPMTPIPLEYNWNLVSYLPNDPMLTEDALISIWSNLIVALGFDAGGVGATSYDTNHPELATLLEMGPTFGYWLKVDAALDLIYPSLPIFFVSEPTDATYTKLSDIPVVAVSNTWINLYGANVTVDGETLPVGAVIQAVNESDVLVGEFVVQDAGRYGFMPVYGVDLYAGVAGSTGETIRLLVDGVEAQETVTWTSNGDRIKVDKFHLTSTAAGDDAVIPDQFTLGQNYPNPFNPETAIEYTLGRSGQVELAIYNVLGTKIKTLVSDFQAKGTYTVKWYGDTDTGERVASGVYLYKLSAQDFTETKKMMLLK
ncbi:MAG: HYR domain-containing protein, partial [bacterium]